MGFSRERDDVYRDYEEELDKINAIYGCAIILFVSALTKQRLLKALEATVKVYESRQQRIATSKFNEYMLKVIEAYPPPATKGSM
jgi:GTP-binding protein